MSKPLNTATRLDAYRKSANITAYFMLLERLGVQRISSHPNWMSWL